MLISCVTCRRRSVTKYPDSESNVQETGDNLSNTGFFDPKQTIARRCAPTKAFGAFLDKNFRRRVTMDQVNEIVGEFAPPGMDACVAPTLEKNILNYIPSSRKEFVKRDRDLRFFNELC